MSTFGLYNRKTSTKTSDDEDESKTPESSTSSPSKTKPPPSSPSGDLAFRLASSQITKLLDLSQKSTHVPSWLPPLITTLTPALVQTLVLIRKATPYVIQGYDMCLHLHATLPIDLLSAIWGMILCFFGGTFALTLAAYEAFKISGWETCKAALYDLKVEYDEFKEVSGVDDEVDEDGDGVEDVKEISGHELVLRKVSLALQVSDPSKVNSALTGLTLGLTGVLATLKSKHARTLTLGVSIGHHLRRPASLYLAPILGKIVSTKYHKWIPYVIDYTSKIVAVTVAWYIAAIVSTVQCAIRGGLMCARGILRHLHKSNLITIDLEDSYIDEGLGWTIAVVGAGFQIFRGFQLPFPLNVVMWPVRVLEYYLSWVVAGGGGGEEGGEGV